MKNRVREDFYLRLLITEEEAKELGLDKWSLKLSPQGWWNNKHLKTDLKDGYLFQSNEFNYECSVSFEYHFRFGLFLPAYPGAGFTPRKIRAQIRGPAGEIENYWYADESKPIKTTGFESVKFPELVFKILKPGKYTISYQLEGQFDDRVDEINLDSAEHTEVLYIIKSYAEAYQKGKLEYMDCMRNIWRDLVKLGQLGYQDN